MSGPDRRLVVLRHAKSDWPAGVADQDRPLGRRGMRDAAAAGRWLVEDGTRPELVWCSPARRTRETWDVLGAELGADSRPDVRFDERVYEAGLADLMAVLQDTPKDRRCVLLVGHNPGVQELVLSLAKGGRTTPARWPPPSTRRRRWPCWTWTGRGPGWHRVAECCRPSRSPEVDARQRLTGGAGVTTPASASASSISSRLIPSR